MSFSKIGSAWTAMSEISDRLRPDRNDHAWVSCVEVAMEDLSGPRIRLLWYTHELTRISSTRRWGARLLSLRLRGGPLSFLMECLRYTLGGYMCLLFIVNEITLIIQDYCVWFWGSSSMSHRWEMKSAGVTWEWGWMPTGLLELDDRFRWWTFICLWVVINLYHPACEQFSAAKYPLCWKYCTDRRCDIRGFLVRKRSLIHKRYCSLNILQCIMRSICHVLPQAQLT